MAVLCLKARLFVVAAVAVSLFVSGNDDCPSVRCCEEDCCGPGTTWNSDFCLYDAGSPGFTGTYSNEWKPGCVERVCCEQNCCGDGTLFDADIASCIPSAADEACAQSGGQVTTGLCCLSTDPFPNTCLIGACGCASDFSHEIQVCSCPEDHCFDGTECVPTVCGSPDDSCMNQDNWQVCRDLVADGCNNVLVLESCPLQFRCGDPKSCGGIAGIECEDGLFCYTGIGDCDEDCKDTDCEGECREALDGVLCGGFAGFTCPDGYECVDSKGDSCSPNCGGADCGGICLARLV